METLPLRKAVDGPYLLLNIDKHEVRLIHLEPASFTDDLRILLETVSLDDEPKYEALSYAWGTRLSPLPILVDEFHLLTITENLDWALRCLRYRSEYNRVLWIDALCINQNDIKERKHQVQLMSKVYSRASEVAIWLGPDAHREFGRLLRHIIYWVAPASPAEFHQLKEDVIRLSKLPWFSRVWVVQELVLSTHSPKVYIGRRYLRWSRLAFALEHFSSMVTEELNQHNTLNWRSMNAFHTIRSLHHLRATSMRQSLHDRLRDTQSLQAKDLRDKVYGILAITRLEGVSISPDYSASIVRVFAQATAAMLRDGDSRLFTAYPLYVPQIEDVPVLNETSARPSWVPDLAFWSTHSPGMYSKMGQYWRADEILEKTAELECLDDRASIPVSKLKLSHNHIVLVASGHILGRISWVSTPEVFEISTVARRLYDLYHHSAKQHGFTARSFGQVLGTWDWWEGDPYSRVAIEELLERSCPGDSATFTGSEEMPSVASHRTIFATDSGHFGRSYHPLPDGIVEGDLLVALFEVDFPFLLRPLRDDKYRMINVAYIVDYDWGYTRDPERYGNWIDSEKPEKTVFRIL